eukprot:TRINITY_DN14639_c0_g1_i1.p1 TRINITY_DN14639_c0_g1~~TRINITY_DN14639_c0_g1_i1.p1  ORF type:complete len:585 (+),score=218.90 TRINITY_DN14639_c0_g1_i1:98-1756(+)
MADKKEWSLRVTTDSGRRYTLEVKGDIASLTAGLLKPKLAASSGVPVDKQVLSFNGQELDDSESFKKLGIQPDAELFLAKRATEVKYFTDVLADAMSGFDAVLEKEGGGREECLQLPEAAKEKVLKDLRRKCAAMKRHVASLAEEVDCVRMEPERTNLLAHVEKEHRRIEEREAILEYLTTGNPLVMSATLAPPTAATTTASAREASPSAVDPLIKPAPAFSHTMKVFYQRINNIHLGIEEVRHRRDTRPIAGKLARLCVNLKVLWTDVLASSSRTALELSIMQSIVTDCRALLVKTLFKYLESPVAMDVCKDEVVMAFSDPAMPIRESHLPPEEAAMAALVRDTARGEVDPAAVVALLYAASGAKTPPQAVPRIVQMSPVASISTSTSQPAAAPAAADSPLAPPNSLVNGIHDGAAPAPLVAATPTAPAAAPIAAEAGAAPAAVEEAAPAVDPNVARALKAGNFWLARVYIFYLKYNPKNMASIGHITSEYRGNEEKLFTHLFEKYNLTDIDKDELQNEFSQALNHLGITPPAAPAGGAAGAPAEEGCVMM